MNMSCLHEWGIYLEFFRIFHHISYADKFKGVFLNMVQMEYDDFIIQTKLS